MKRALIIVLIGLAAPAFAQQPANAPAAIAELETATKRSPNDPKVWVLLGLAYWDRNEYPRALAAFQRAVTVGPQSAEAHNWLGVALAEKADLPAAIAAFRKAVALDPQYGRAYTNLGSTLAQSGDYGEAVQIFRKALALEPNSTGAHMNLGVALRETGDLEGALEHLRGVAAANPRDAAVHYELGQTLRQSGDLGGAIAAFERAIEVNPELREGYYGLGAALKQQSATAKKPLPSPASPADDVYRRAQEAAARGDLKAARDQVAEALRLDDNHAGAHSLLGFTLGQMGDLSSSLDHSERAIRLRPESSEAHYNLGVALWYADAKERAVGELRESVRLDPAAGSSYAFLGTALRDRGDWPGARSSLQRAIALLPPTAAVYIDLGITFLRMGEVDRALGQMEAGLNLPSPSLPKPDWESAVAALRQAPTAHANGAEAHNVLGLLLGRKGANSTEVAAEFREAIRLRSDFAEAHNNLGLVLIQAGDDPGGIAALRAALRISPEYAEARANLGAALTPTDPEEAVRELERAVALAPGSVKAQFNLAVAYGTSPAHGVAQEIDTLRNVIELSPTFPRARLALGRALLRDAKVAEAIAELQEVTKLEPDNGEAHYQLGLALARSGRKEEATTALKRGRELVAANDRAQNARLDAAEGRVRDDSRRIAEFEGYIRDGKFQEVEPLLAEYVKERPQSSWGWYALGYSRFAQQKIGESIKALSKCLELDIRDAEAHKILGRNLMIIGRFDAAQIEFEQAIHYKPESAESHYNLGKLHSIQDSWGPARKAFEAALRIDASYLEALDALGLALEALGDDAGALAQYEKAIALNEARGGKFASAHVNLSAYYNRTGDPQKAHDFARKALEIEPQSDRALFQKARADERQGNLDEAVNALNEAISVNPRASSYYYVLAGVYRRLGWMDESRKALDVFKRLERESSELEKKRRTRE